MKIWDEYLETKSVEDDFLQWLLIRKSKIVFKVFFIVSLFCLWIYLMPSLTRWVIFFKVMIVVAVLFFAADKIIDIRKKGRGN
ncbi:hypothetical protein [Vagococcus hydrophili]|uniref:Uncharacterized protein n=1 Tax=Vagococcus hydrophili TaxID=2714947 RepID=A0A6G8AS13_9ENTE|nr:hypothetical protein [Vagococcus hydrophili]QIL47780.1 hypothetical protein G7082_04100 [Vagococcus hydrophili]